MPHLAARRLLLAPLLGATLLGGCVSLGPKVPDALLTLTPAARLPAGPARTITNARAIMVTVPSAVQSIASQRVPVASGPTSLAYLKDAQWADVPAKLFRDLLAETIEQRTGRVIPDLRLPALAPDTRLSGRLEMFGVDAASSSVVVTYDAVLSRDGRETAQARRFEARVPVAAIDAVAVPPALNQAANQVATEVADWVGGG